MAWHCGARIEIDFRDAGDVLGSLESTRKIKRLLKQFKENAEEMGVEFKILETWNLVERDCKKCVHYERCRRFHFLEDPIECDDYEER